jgi:ribosomal protein L37AE/L43A
MKIKKIYRDEEEPMGCNTCPEDNNALNCIEIEANEKLTFNVWLCDKCLKKLNKRVK